MLDPRSVAEAIDKMMDDRYANPGSFDDFCERLLTLGIHRFHFDAFTNQTHFHAEREFIHTMTRKDLAQARSSQDWTIGTKFDAEEVEQSIARFDASKISPVQFHMELLAAGVTFCHVFLNSRKIYYMGSDGQYFLENY